MGVSTDVGEVVVDGVENNVCGRGTSDLSCVLARVIPYDGKVMINEP